MPADIRSPLLSVIIPTFNRAEYLRHSLESLVSQTIPRSDFEVVVIDDGSSDDTRRVCRQYEGALSLRYHYQENSGIAAAKNLGIFCSRAPLLFFFDDDDVADRDLLKEHLRSHQANPQENVAVLGYTTWASSLKMTPVMHFVTEVGHFLFSYSNLKDGQLLDFTYFWGGRSSCKRSLLVKHGIFNPRFRFGSEDIELGYRLSKLGLKVHFNRKAVSYMIRPITYDEFCRRCERQGRSQYSFSRLHPDPVIRQYCMTIKAEEKWRYAEKSFDHKIAKVHQIESALEFTLPEKGWVVIPPELGSLYWWTFNAFKIKGIVEAMREKRPTDAAGVNPSPGRDVPQQEARYFADKWSTLPSLPASKGNILVIDPFLPMFDRASGSLRLFQILKAFLKLGYHITFIARDSVHSNQYLPLLREMGIEVYAGDPSALEASGVNCIAPYLDMQKVLKDRAYQTVILDFWNLAEYYLPLVRKNSPSSRIIIDTVDVHFLREYREAELKNDPRLREKARLNKEREIAVYRKADRLWVVTEEDKRSIEDLVGQVPIDVVPNVHEKVAEVKTYEATSDLLFVGNFNHLPNRDGVAYFCREIFPGIQRQLPHVKIHIVGNNPPEEVKSLASDRIRVAGYVKDLAPYLLKARISVSPLRYGAGMKGKIGEALSWGLPVVTTPIGAEGMGLVDGEDALIADSAETFSAKVVRLYQDRDLWECLSTSGKRKVERLWSPEATQTRLEAILGGSEPVSERGLVSIVIPVRDQLDYTRKCLESILTHTNKPFELILVDNGSSPSTAGELKGIREGRIPVGGWRLETDDHGKVLSVERTESLDKRKKKGKKRAERREIHCRSFKLIRNEENRGFAAGNNQGMAEAKGDYIVLMNNDVVVTPKWLEGLVSCAEKKPEIGMVGPMSNYVSGPQWVNEVTYDTASLSNLDAFAERFAAENDGRTKPFWRVVGFCMLIKRAVIARIGGLDERYGLGNFEDDDFSLRAALAGYESRIAMDCFVHHFGNRTFAGSKIDYRESLERNWAIFKRKWSLPEDVDYGSPYDLAGILKEGFVPLKHFYPLNESEMTMRRGEELFAAGDLDGAKFIFKKILTRDPKNAEALNNLGVIAFQSGHADQALSCFQTVLEADPAHVDAMENLGNCLAALGRHPEAVDWFEKALKVKPDEVALLNGLGNSFVQLEDFQRAKEIYHQSYRLNHSQAHVREILSNMERLTLLESPGEIRP